jgi:hypothetical protein
LSKADSTAASTGRSFTEAFGISPYGCNFLLLFLQDLIESANGLFKFAAESFGAFSVAFFGELSNAASPARALDAATGGATATGCRRIAGHFTTFAAAVAITYAFAILAHAADAARHSSAITAVAILGKNVVFPFRGLVRAAFATGVTFGRLCIAIAAAAT